MCGKCKEVVNHKDFNFCPYCGGNIAELREVLKAVGIIESYCNVHDCCNCIFDNGSDKCPIQPVFLN